MKKLYTSVCIIVLLLFVQTAKSQSWVDLMQDPTVNFYEVQKKFNKEFQKKEKEMQREKFEAFQKQKKADAKNPSNVNSIPQKGMNANVSAEGKEEAEGELPGWELYKRWENFMMPRLYPSGDRSVMINAWNDYLDSYYAGPMRAAAPSAPTPMAANWTLIGPTTTIPSGGGGAGRVNFVRFDPTNTNNIFVGSPGGGLWKSTNGGTSWATQTDQLAVIGCTDLAIHPTVVTTMYLATGDGEAQDTYSIGVLKTTDGGTNWLPTGLTWAVTNGRTISRLLINPQNPNTLFAATSNGVYRTLNAGTSWTQIATAVANVKDIEYKPGDTTTVYACSTTLFYKSTNGGTSFVTTATGLPAAASLSRLAIAVTAAAAADVYVLAANTAFGYQGLYLSTNSGTSFVAASTTPNILGYSNTGATAGGQGWYDLSIAVSPTNASLVIVGGVNIWKSTNGGSTWTLNAEWTGTGAPYVHADIHALEFLPASATTYFAGCDGGFFKTANTGTAWSDLSNGLQISQAYRIGLSTTNANLLNTGWQDNGTARWTGTSAWTRPLGGDGMECIVDWSNANVQYGELYYGDIRKTTTGGNYTTQIVASGGTAGTVNADGDWVTPYVEAPSNAATLFVGKSQVFKSTNSGGTWAQVGTISGGTGNLIAVANAASNINYIYAAKIDKFYACTTGAAFVDRTAGLPTASAAISYIAIDPLNANRVWVTFSGYSAANKVWYSANAGATWTNYSTGLPNLPANCIVYQGSSSNDPMYVGTDVGVYYKDNTAGSWTAYNSGLPNVSVRELEIQYTALKLRAATFGRGIWQSDLYNPGTAVPVADFVANRTNICVGDCINFTDLSAGSPTSWAWTFTGAVTTTSTIQNPTSICYNTPGTYQVSMTATNANGNNTMTKTLYITVSATIALPLVEGFQGATFVPSGWYLNNPDADAYTWIWSSVTGGFGTSTKCTSIDNYSPAASTAGNIDELSTPKYNFTGVSTATMTFDVAYARYGLGTGGIMYADSLTAFVSTNCGATWTAVYAKGGYSNLATAPDNNTSAFVPTAAQWRTETVNMTPYAGQANVMVKFQARSGWGQWLYLDNINITGTGSPIAAVSIAQTSGTNPECAGACATYTATPTNGGTTPIYQWQVNGVNAGTNSPTFNTCTLTNGQIVTCIMTSNLPGVIGSPATSNALTMAVNALPATPTATNTGAYCAGATITLNTPTVAGATYAWTGPLAYSSALQNPTIAASTVAMAGTYSVTVTVGGCTSAAGTTTVVVNPTPATPTATNTGPYCAGATIFFNTPTVAGATYSWTGPSAYSSALQNPTRFASTVAMSGTYSVTVTVGGCTSAMATTNVVVTAVPATPTASNTGPYCAGSTISLSTPTVAGATYAWTGPLAYSSATQNPTIPAATVGMAGTYSVTVTVSGCTSVAGTTAVIVNAAPATPVATNIGPYCVGSTISLATPTVAGATYAWTGPLAYSSALQNPTRPAATLAMAGIYSVTITVGGCTSAAGTTTVVVNAIPATPTATNTGPYCAGGTISLSTPTVAGATYAWTGPLAYSSSTQNPTIAAATVAMAGTYSVTVSVGGCASAAGTTAVVVNAAPSTPTASNTGPYCAGSPIALSTPTVAGATYAWTGPSAYSSAIQNPTIASSTVAMAGTYSVTITVAGCTSAAGTTTVVVNALPATPVATNTGPYCVGSTITLATPTVAGATYAWTGPGAYSSALQNPTRPAATLAMAGTYSVTVTVAGCTSLAGTTAVVVNAAPSTPTASNTGPYCAGGTITLATPTVAGATYNWTGPLAYSSATQNPTIAAATIAMTGTYSVTVSVGGCTSASGTTAVLVNAAPATPTASNTGAYCAGATIALATPTVAGATYSWTGPSAYSSAIQNPTIASSTIAMAGTYSLTVNVAGCTSAAGTTTVVVNPTVAPSAIIAITAGGNPTCAGQSITFTATPTNGGTTPSYQWQVNGSNVGTNSTTYTTSTLTSGQIVTCILTSNATCASPLSATSNAITIVVNSTLVPAVSIAITTGTNPSCTALSVTFTATPTNGGTTPSYQWQVNGSNVGTNSSTYATTTLTTGQTVTCIMTSNSPCAVPTTGTSAGITMTINPIPAAPTAGSNTPVCAGSAINLTSNTIAGATYSWTGPATFTSALEDPTIAAATTAMAGTYSVNVTVGGCTSANATTAVVVNALPATPVPSSNSPVCLGSNILLTCPSAGGGATYAWTGPNTYSAAVRNPPGFVSTALSSGTYTITVTKLGCTSLPGTVNVVVNPLPATPTPSSNSPVCVGSTLNLTIPTIAGATYAWTGPTAYTSALQNPTRPAATVAMSGTYSLTVTVAGCTSLPGTTAVVVNTTVTPTVTIAASPSGAICAGTSVVFTATPAGGGTTPSYQWQVNGVNVGTNSATYTDATLTNGQIVTCILSSSSACASPTTATSTGITMTVNPVVVPTNSVSIVVGSNPMCAGSTITFISTITNGGTTPVYQWQVNGSNAGTNISTFTSSTMNNGDVVTCTLTSNAACASPAAVTSAGITMTVNPIPTTPVITQAGMLLSSSSATGNQWYLNGTIIPGATNQTYTATANGTYTVVVTTAGCSSAISAPIIITTTGIMDATNGFGLTVSPNPNDGNFVIDFNTPTASTYKIELYNALGQIIFKDELKDFKGEYKKSLNVVEYGKGIYTISITNSKNEIVKKIIVY